MMKHIVFIFFLSILLQACNSTSKNKQDMDSKADLIAYFETNDIVFEKENKIVQIEIKNSALLQREQEKKGTRWTNSEAFSSIGALMFYDKLSKEVDIDSVVFKINIKSGIEKYVYSIDNLKNVKSCVDIGLKFCGAIKKQDYETSKNNLGNEILGSLSTAQIGDLFNSIRQNGIEDYKLIAFNVHDGIIGLYFNVYYNNGEAQTYIFSFRLNGDNKIAGIQSV